MAVVGRGQEVTWRWPAKNHASTPNAGNLEIFISRTADGGDDFSHITQRKAGFKSTLDSQFHILLATLPGANIDRADCRGGYTVPTDLTPGVYTFMWWWNFNPGQFTDLVLDSG